MTTTSSPLSRAEKIILFIYEFGNGMKAKVRYEDIVVGVFKKYPHDYHLKGYPEYPDSGDLIHKPLYDFKKKGYINAANKIFTLTDSGIEFARSLSGKESLDNASSSDRLSRTASVEVRRIQNLEGFNFFISGKERLLSESDFYSYLNVTVRTQKNAFIGRLEVIESVNKELRENHPDPLHLKIVAYGDFLLKKNADLIKYFTQK